nr:hypothetical protein [Tanacetum cinerariifolium]
MTSLEMQETKVYKTYIGYATGVTPPKKARKFKKHASPKLSTIPALPEEPTRKSKRFKRPTKKSSDASTVGVIIRETPVKYLCKKKEKMIVEIRKGINFLSEVALTEEAQYEEVQKKSLRDFHKTHPSSSGTVTKIAPSAAKIKPSITNKGTGVKPRVLDVTEEESTESEAESGGKDEDDNYSEHDSRSEGSDQERDSGDDNTQSDSEKGSDSKHETDENESGSESDQEENEEEIEDDEEEEEDNFVKPYLRMNEPVTTDEGFIQKEGTDAEMTNVQQVNENPKTTLNQVIENAHVTLSTVPQKTKVLVTSSSHSSKLVSKFLKFSNIPHTDAENVSPMDVHVRHEIFYTAAQPDPAHAKKSEAPAIQKAPTTLAPSGLDFYVDLDNSLKVNESTSIRALLLPHGFTRGLALLLICLMLLLFILLTLSLLVLLVLTWSGSIVIGSSEKAEAEGDSSLEYTYKQWDAPHALEDNILYVVADAEDRFNIHGGEVSNFVGSGIVSLVRRLVHGCTDSGFEEVAQNVSKFFGGAKVEFNKVIANLPFIKFPFLAKIDEASEGVLLEIANIQLDKLFHPISIPTTDSAVAKTSALEGSKLPGFGLDVPPPSFV